MSEADFPMQTTGWASRKLWLTVMVMGIVCACAALGKLEGLYLCISLVVPSSLYLGGQSLIDAAKAVAIAKFSAPK